MSIQFGNGVVIAKLVRGSTTNVSAVTITSKDYSVDYCRWLQDNFDALVEDSQNKSRSEKRQERTPDGKA